MAALVAAFVIGLGWRIKEETPSLLKIIGDQDISNLFSNPSEERFVYLVGLWVY
jgi:hypothetical protein